MENHRAKLLLNIRTVAPDVPKWRHEETLSDVDRVEAFVGLMDPDGLRWAVTP